MQNYALSTWVGDRMLGHEPLVAESITEVKAFVHGMVTERVKNHRSMLVAFGIRYVIEHGHRTLALDQGFARHREVGEGMVVTGWRRGRERERAGERNHLG